MKSVCAKHEQAYLVECPYCETKAEGPVAAPAAPPVASVMSPFAKAMDARIQTVKDMIAKGLLYGIDPALPPLMNVDACPVCGKSGLEIMRAGETYKTHKCFRITP